MNLIRICSLFNIAPTYILLRELKCAIVHLSIECYMCPLQSLKVLLLILIQTKGRINFKSMVKELALSKFVQFYLYSTLN